MARKPIHTHIIRRPHHSNDKAKQPPSIAHKLIDVLVNMTMCCIYLFILAVCDFEGIIDGGGFCGHGLRGGDDTCRHGSGFCDDEEEYAVY